MPKAQSAVEYLMTYGWMLLVVAVVGGAVFTIIGDQSIESVSGFNGGNVIVDDFGLTEDSLQFVLRNGGSEEVEIHSIRISDPSTGVTREISSLQSISISDSSSVELEGVESSDNSENHEIEVIYDTGSLENLSVSGTVTGSFDVFNHIDLVSADFNRSTDDLNIEVKNTGSSVADSISYTVSTNDTDFTGSLSSLDPDEIGKINISTDQTYPLESVSLDADGPQFVDSNSDLKCTPTKGLVGYWTFNDEQTKNGWAADLSGQGNNGSLEENPDTGNAGVVGESYMYDETNYVRTDDGLTTVDITLSGWVKYSQDAVGDSGGFGNPIIEDNGDYTSALFADMNNDNQRFYIYPDDASGSSNIGTSISKGEWIFVTGVREGTETRLYIDEDLRTTGSTTDGKLTIPNWDFAHPAGSSRAFLEGKIDDIRVHNRSLSQQEIQTLYNVRSEDWAVSGCKLTG